MLVKGATQPSVYHNFEIQIYFFTHEELIDHHKIINQKGKIGYKASTINSDLEKVIPYVYKELGLVTILL